jgi:predicted nucleic acid-binding protein
MGTALSGCVVDTNIIIYHLAGALNNKAEAVLRRLNPFI